MKIEDGMVAAGSKQEQREQHNSNIQTAFGVKV
jgi:hypothetical protein